MIRVTAIPGQAVDVSMGEPYGKEHAERVVRAAMEDYDAEYGSGK